MANVSKDDEHYELLELIDREIERISAITHQMYQLYRPSLQQPSRFDLRRTIADVILLVAPLLKKAGTGVTKHIRDCVRAGSLGDTEVVLREGEVKQILLNVVRNAIQASPPGTTVDITLSTSAQHAGLTVVDQGTGIPEEIAGRLFEPFFTTRAGARDGMGLGLSVSRSLVDAMGGDISIANNPGAPGACVTLLLPRRIADDE